MDFQLSSEQHLIQDSVRRLLAQRYSFDKRRGYLAETAGWSRDLWSAYAELGLLGLPFGESLGGVGGGSIEIMVVMESFGRALVLEPYLATVVLGGGFLREAGDRAQQALIPQVIGGDLTLAAATMEPQSSYDLADIATTARPNGEGWILNGEKSLVLHGGSADRLIIPARVAGERRDVHGIVLFLLDAQAQGISRRSYAMQDGLQAADILLRSVHAEASDMIGRAGEGFPVLERIVDEAIAAVCAEAVGAMSALQELTVEHLRTRQQFGVPIGSFQALQHRAVDMFIAVEQARSMALYAAMSVRSERAVERRKAVCAAKAHVARSARYVGQEAIQLHGALGMSQEYAAGHYFRRLTMIDLAFGNGSHHVRELARLGGLLSN
jgi:pimeloyl-CoA dehydrogenase small subunit